MTTSDTPRTDRLTTAIYNSAMADAAGMGTEIPCEEAYGCAVNLAKELERELSAANARIAELEQELHTATERASKAEHRACVLDHPKGHYDTRDEIEMFLRDAYASGCNAAWSHSLLTAMEYAKREAPKLRELLRAAANARIAELEKENERLREDAERYGRRHEMAHIEIERLRAQFDYLLQYLVKIYGLMLPEAIHLPDGRVFEFNNPEIERKMLRGLCDAIRGIPVAISAASKEGK